MQPPPVFVSWQCDAQHMKRGCGPHVTPQPPQLALSYDVMRHVPLQQLPAPPHDMPQ